MPNPNDTLEAALLQKATSIGPATGTQNLPVSKFESQQPDPVQAMDQLLGVSDFSGLDAGLPPIRGGQAVDALIEHLSKFMPEGYNMRKVLQVQRSTPHRVPPTGFVNPPPKSSGLELPHETPIKRSPQMNERYAQQRQADLRTKATNPDPSLPLSSVLREEKPVLSRLQKSGGSQGGARPALRGKVDVESVRTIREMAATGQPIEAIMQKYPSLSKAGISGIIRRDTWSWVK